MANIKYSEDTCSDIISNLEKVSLALADVESALSTYISSQPSDYKIDRRVDKLSEEEDPETGRRDQRARHRQYRRCPAASGNDPGRSLGYFQQ